METKNKIKRRPGCSYMHIASETDLFDRLPANVFINVLEFKDRIVQREGWMTKKEFLKEEVK